MLRLLALSLFFLTGYTAFAENTVPKLFKIEWGNNFSQVQEKILLKELGFSALKHYPVYQNRTEADDLRLSSFIKYSSNGIPFYNIPGEIIFTFYNPDQTKNKLQLSKIEVYLSKKDLENRSVDIKSVFKNFISVFCDLYQIQLTTDLEKIVFSKYAYQVTYNGVYINFLANIGTTALSNQESLFISYENNDIRNRILRKELDKLKETEETKKSIDTINPDENIRGNL